MEIAVLAQGVALAALLITRTVEPLGAASGASYGVLADLLIGRGLLAAGLREVGVANAITWTRCVLVTVVVALVVAPAGPLATDCLVAAAAVALLLDGVDGRVARTSGTVSTFGARFDMEVDASLVLALSVAAVSRVGGWILLVGAARYLLMVAAQLAPRLAGPTPPRLWRKAVAVGQAVVLMVVCAGALPQPVEEAIAVVAAAALAWSFATQIIGLLKPAVHEPRAISEAADARVG